MNGLNIKSKDLLGRTSLHWACDYNSKNAAMFCLAWGLDIND